MIVKAEQRIKELAARRKARGGVRDKEYQDDKRRDAHQDIFLLVKSAGEEVGDSDRADLMGVDTQLLCDKQPVDVCTGSQTDNRPAHVGDTAEVGKSGQTHKQVAAHIGSLRAHGGDDRTELSSAEVEVAYVLVLLGEFYSNNYHQNQI